MTSSFELTGRAFRNARVLQIRVHRLERYPPVDELFAEISEWFAAAQSVEEDHRLAEVRARLARIRGSVVFGLLPFDDAGLQLEAQLGEAMSASRQYPFLSDRMGRIEILVRFLLESPENPKGRLVFDHLAGLKTSKRLPAGLVSPRTRLPIPGWGLELRALIAERCGHVEVLTSPKRLQTNGYCNIVLPWGGRGCPFLYELLHSFGSPEVDTFVYDCERVARPAQMLLPRGAPIPIQKPGWERPQGTEVEEDHGEPDWKRADFWAALRKAPPAQNLAEEQNDHEFIVRARLVLLANEKKVFLNEESKVIEVSALVEGEEDAGDWKRFPRVPVRELRAGDLIVLRTGGSGDYLISVADALMAKEGNADLRERALDWKVALRKALEDLGSHVIAALLESKNLGVQNHRYIWTWTTHDVIRPRSEGLFYEILAILNDIGYIESEALETAESRWALMKEIIAYHHRAGVQIRNALLRRLRKLVRAGERIDDCLALTLPGVDSGELSVLRVAAVDPQVVEVPHQRIGTLFSLYE